MGAKTGNGGEQRTRDGELTRATETLIRKLVAQTAHAPLQREVPPGEKREVLFTGEVDGVRCELVKTHPGAAESASLSPREQEIARMIAKGYPNKMIADVLDISVWTVATHLRRIFAKFGVNSRAAMVARIITAGKL